MRLKFNFSFYLFVFIFQIFTSVSAQAYFDFKFVSIGPSYKDFSHDSSVIPELSLRIKVNNQVIEAFDVSTNKRKWVQVCESSNCDLLYKDKNAIALLMYNYDSSWKLTKEALLVLNSSDGQIIREENWPNGLTTDKPFVGFQYKSELVFGLLKKDKGQWFYELQNAITGKIIQTYKFTNNFIPTRVTYYDEHLVFYSSRWKNDFIADMNGNIVIQVSSLFGELSYFFPAKNYVALSESDNQTDIYNYKTGKKVLSVPHVKAVIPDTNRFYLQHGNSIAAYDNTTLRKIWEIPNSSTEKFSLSMSNHLISLSNQIKIFNKDNGVLAGHASLPSNIQLCFPNPDGFSFTNFNYDTRTQRAKTNYYATEIRGTGELRGREWCYGGIEFQLL